uniref:Secreted protein n=1 Tax=Oryza barthii TaxID=65489 RepID=A0A0D3GSQ6_9ORYZ
MWRVKLTWVHMLAAQLFYLSLLPPLSPSLHRTTASPGQGWRATVWMATAARRPLDKSTSTAYTAPPPARGPRGRTRPPCRSVMRRHLQ